MNNAIRIWSVARRSVAFSALVVGAGSLWVNAPAHGQTAPSSYTVIDRSRIAIDVEIRIRHGSEAEFLALIRQRVAISRSDAAVVDFRVLATSDPLDYRAIETFTDELAFRAFASSASSADFAEQLKPLLSAPLAATLLRPLP